MTNSKPIPSTLLIWEEIPDNTRLYLIPNDALTEDDKAALTGANGEFINLSGVNDTIQRCLDHVSHALTKVEYGGSGRWIKYKKELPLGDVDVKRVFVSGIVC